ncbi:MAG: hypothetical protein KJ006_05190 [Thermoleophilia bacterium]|nr:hypothetical protein [Thermoleophilia bacterium]
MRRHGHDIVPIRETEAGGCHACGWNLSQWEKGYSIDLVVEAVFLDPALLEPLFIRRCPGCGARYDWDIVVAEDEDPEREWDQRKAQQADLLEALGTMLRTPRLQPADAAGQIRRRFGVEGIYVEDGSEVEWPLRRLLDGSG